MNNCFGLDANYFREALGMIVRDVERYTPAEMTLALERLSQVARGQFQQTQQQPKKKE